MNSSIRWTIREARSDELPALQAIERAAAERFRDDPVGPLFAAHGLSLAELERGRAANLLWVGVASDGELAGFALVSRHGAEAHLDEIDVGPAHGGQRLASALLETLCAELAQAGCLALTLSTLADVAWNAPSYARRGFATLAESEWDERLRVCREAERAAGFPMARRVLMRRELALGAGR
ncbi:GNAT family N-acetyltransferase [Neisseriaceae bacterium JH1-16]|nr:GNAT family N-acetyltransferase [Neisseriaceae bacterium JH1-16]